MLQAIFGMCRWHIDTKLLPLFQANKQKIKLTTLWKTSRLLATCCYMFTTIQVNGWLSSGMFAKVLKLKKYIITILYYHNQLYGLRQKACSRLMKQTDLTTAFQVMQHSFSQSVICEGLFGNLAVICPVQMLVSLASIFGNFYYLSWRYLILL